MWSSEQIALWRSRQKAYLADRTAVEQDQAIDHQRTHVRQEILQVLNSFLDGGIGLKAFNATFQQRTHSGWSAFYLRGMSGGLFFNQLVQRVPNEETFAHLLRLMIRAPEDRREAQQRMQAFVRFLEGLIDSQQVQRAQLQPARVPFFQSIWWHMQAQEGWPIFYSDVRHAILTESGTSPSDPIDTYFSFCTHFLVLAQELGLSSWELEHLCRWSVRQDVASDTTRDEKHSVSSTPVSKSSSFPKQSCVLARRTEAKSQQPTNDKESREIIACRTHLQWLLAKIGHKVGCQAWVATSDHNKVCKKERLGDLSLPSLPILADSTFQKVVSKIDVLWLMDQWVIAAYEIEQACTDVSISLLRLYDLKALFPDRQMTLCLVAPQERFEKVQFELSRPAFQMRDIQKHCALCLFTHGFAANRKHGLAEHAPSRNVKMNKTRTVSLLMREKNAVGEAWSCRKTSEMLDFLHVLPLVPYSCFFCLPEQWSSSLFGKHRFRKSAKPWVKGHRCHLTHGFADS